MAATCAEFYELHQEKAVWLKKTQRRLNTRCSRQHHQVMAFNCVSMTRIRSRAPKTQAVSMPTSRAGQLLEANPPTPNCATVRNDLRGVKGAAVDFAVARPDPSNSEVSLISARFA